jgi:hypothetical protein
VSLLRELLRPKKTSVLPIALPKNVGTGNVFTIIFIFSFGAIFLNFVILNVTFRAI